VYRTEESGELAVFVFDKGKRLGKPAIGAVQGNPHAAKLPLVKVLWDSIGLGLLGEKNG
jgi:hypothetical protein